MRNLSTAFLLLGVTAISALGQYKADSAGTPPSDIPAAYSALLQKDGTKILDAQGKAFVEIWLVTAAPSGPKTSEENVTLTTVPHGSLMGVLRFPMQWYDRRGQTVKPGLYTVRFSMFPISGDHQGVAPQRDFWVLTKLSDDPDPKATPKYEDLMKWSQKASGTPHPLVMSVWKADDAKADFSASGESDWVLQRKMGDTWIAIVVVGKAAA